MPSLLEGVPDSSLVGESQPHPKPSLGILSLLGGVEHPIRGEASPYTSGCPSPGGQELGTVRCAGIEGENLLT